MMTFVNIDAPGITILPTHRVAFGLNDFNGRDFADQRRSSTSTSPRSRNPHRPLPRPRSPAQATQRNRRRSLHRRHPRRRLPPHPEARSHRPAARRPPQAPAATRRHAAPQSDPRKTSGPERRNRPRRRQHPLPPRSLRSPQQVGSGNADVAFLIKPVTLEQMKDISLNLEVMPQKSTDFYPKLLSGLAMYTLD